MSPGLHDREAENGNTATKAPPYGRETDLLRGEMG